VKNGCNTSESLCASCARAYARPDPAGCAFHRRDYLTRELEGHPYSRAKMVDRGHRDAVIIVQECGPYVPSPKEADRLAALARKAERAGVSDFSIEDNDTGRTVHIRKSDAWKLAPDELAGWEIVMDLDRRAAE